MDMSTCLVTRRDVHFRMIDSFPPFMLFSLRLPSILSRMQLYLIFPQQHRLVMKCFTGNGCEDDVGLFSMDL